MKYHLVFKLYKVLQTWSIFLKILNLIVGIDEVCFFKQVIIKKVILLSIIDSIPYLSVYWIGTFRCNKISRTFSCKFIEIRLWFSTFVRLFCQTLEQFFDTFIFGILWFCIMVLVFTIRSLDLERRVERGFTQHWMIKVMPHIISARSVVKTIQH